VITIIALLIRAWFQHDRLFWGDEIGTLHYIETSPEYLLSHFAPHLTMNYFILAEKGIAWLCGATDWRLTLLPLAGAIATVPLTASLALKFTGSRRTALIAGGLAAFNPFLIYWGPQIRSYSLLVALSLLAINEFFHWYQQRNWWNGVRCGTAVLLLLLAHINGVYTVAFLILLVAIEIVSRGWSGGRKFLWESGLSGSPLVGRPC
jgi:4-amino-4-deoxy-L-arabinose transferase-like glycosyltransferase